MLFSVTLAAVIGIVGAWAESICSRRGGWHRMVAKFFVVCMITAIAIPMILHAAAWESTAGKFGWVALTQTGPRSYGGLSSWLGGLFACGWIHGLIGAAFVTLATSHGCKNVPVGVVRQAELEMGPMAGWWSIYLKHALPWTLLALFATATLAATEMTVADLYGFRTLADEFYRYFAGAPTWSSLLMCSIIPALLGVTAVLVYRFFGLKLNPQRSETNEVWHRESVGAFPSAIAVAALVVIAATIVIVPVAGLLIKVGHNVVVQGDQRTVGWSWSVGCQRLAEAPRTFFSEYSWTFCIALGAAIPAVVLGWACAMIGRRAQGHQRLFDLTSVVLVLIPGPVVGLMVVRFFQLPLPGFRDLYANSLVPTIIALLFRAAPVAYWILRAGYRGIDDQLLSASRLELGPARRMWVIDAGLLRGSLLTAFLASALVASADVPATLPVVPASVVTVGTRLFALLHSGARYQEAALAIWYVSLIVVIAVIWSQLGRRNRAKLM